MPHKWALSRMALAVRAPGQEAPSQGTQTLREMEEYAILCALEECRGNKSRAAKLGISRKTFYKRLKEIEPARSGV